MKHRYILILIAVVVAVAAAVVVVAAAAAAATATAAAVVVVVVMMMTTTTTTTTTTMMMMMMMIIIIIMLTTLSAFEIFLFGFVFYNPLTAPLTVSKSYAQMATTLSCANHAQHSRHLSSVTCRVPRGRIYYSFIP